jgi:hypothetical protein
MMNEALRRGFMMGIKVARFDMLKSLVAFRKTLDRLAMARQWKSRAELCEDTGTEVCQESQKLADLGLGQS